MQPNTVSKNIIKKVERTKFKDVKPFMLLGEDALQTPITAADTKETKEQKDCTFKPAGTRVFKVKKTPSPDVYELYNDKMEMQGIACIPTLKISKYMRLLTKSMNMVDKIEATFELSDKFQKWIPIVS